VKGTEIRSVSTVQIAMQPNVLWVQVETADGALGLGETFFGADAVRLMSMRPRRPYLLGKDALDITAHWRALYRLWSRKGVGAEARGASAVDIALWDLFGQVTGCRSISSSEARSANRSVSTTPVPGLRTKEPDCGRGIASSGWHSRVHPTKTCGPSSTHPRNSPRAFWPKGISTMKIWPFDATLAFDGGQLAGREVVASGIAILERIRRGMGDRMEVALEMRSRWLLPAAKRIVAAVEPYDPLWIEDPIRNDNLEALAELARATRIPIAAGENLGSRFRHRELVASTRLASCFPTPRGAAV